MGIYKISKIQYHINVILYYIYYIYNTISHKCDIVFRHLLLFGRPHLATCCRKVAPLPTLPAFFI